MAAIAATIGTLPGCASTRFRLAPRARDIVATKDIVYRPGSENPKHRLDVYAPEDASGLPVVHFVHGGYWTGGDKDYFSFVAGLYGSIGEALADRGIVTVIQSYRLVPEVPFETLLDDVMTGLKWTEDHIGEYGGNPNRIYLMGHSAGGHLTALAGTDDAVHTSRGMNPSAVKGYIPISGIWDIADMQKTQPPEFNEQITYPVFGRDPAKWSRYSPMDRMTTTPHRFLVMIGEDDYPYLIPQAQRAKSKLESLGGHPAFHLAPEATHDKMVLRFGTSNDDLTSAVLEFVSR